MRVPLLLCAAILLRADSFKPVFATYLGGGGNEVVGSVVADSQGNIYVAGRTDSSDFPVKNAIQPESRSYSQIFIAKFSPTGELLYSTYLGGSANDLASAIATDPAGNVYVTGTLQSRDFPTTNPFQAESGGGVDGFVLKLDSSGNIVYSTYLGGRNNDFGMAIAADAQGNAYITGRTESPDFPVSPGAFQTEARSRPFYAFIDAYVTKLDASGKLVYSTFLGGSDSDMAWGITVDDAGQAHVAGETTSLDFPVTRDAMQVAPGRSVQVGPITADGFLIKLASDGSRLVYGTYIGGPADDKARAVTLDADGNAYITGITRSARLPVINGPQRYLGGDVLLVSGDGGNTFVPRRAGLAAAIVTGIAFDPNVASLEYAGTAQGVFRSTDGGNSWTSAGLDNLSITQVAVDPARPGTIYAATDFGGGVYRSTDSGDTWISWNSGAPGDTRGVSFQALAVDPSGSGTVYVVAGNGGIGAGYDQPLFRITEEGARWTLLGAGLPSTPLALAVASDSTLFAGTTAFQFFSFFGTVPAIPGTVYRRVSGGWASTNIDDDIHGMAWQGNTLFAAGRQFYRSTDAGQTWSATALPGTGIAGPIAVDPANPSTIFVLKGNNGDNLLLRSVDGGRSFDTVPLRGLNTIAVNPLDSSLHAGSHASADAFVAGYDLDGKLIYSSFAGNASVEMGDSIARDHTGHIYIAGFRSPGDFTIGYQGNTFVSRIDETGYSVDLGGSTTAILLGMPGRALTVAPDGAVVAVMIATQPDLPVVNAFQTQRNGDTDVYLVKWFP